MKITNRWRRALFSITKRISKEIQYDIAHYRNPTSETNLLAFYTKQQLPKYKVDATACKCSWKPLDIVHGSELLPISRKWAVGFKFSGNSSLTSAEQKQDAIYISHYSVRNRHIKSAKEEAKPSTIKIWATMEKFYTKKLWHQLSVCVRDATLNKEFVSEITLVKFYENFVRHFEDKVKPLILANIIVQLAYTENDKEVSLELVKKVRNVVKSEDKAVIICISGCIYLKCFIRDSDGSLCDQNGILKLMKEAEDLLKNIDGDHTNFYVSGLRYLGSMNYKFLRKQQRPLLAYQLGVSALLSKQVYMFGELATHRILRTLKGTDKEWMLDVIRAFDRGDRAAFENLRPRWSKEAILNVKSNFLEEKMHLMSLLSAAQVCASKRRPLQMTEISRRENIPMTDVDILLVKAMSMKLISGNIDQVEGCVYISWVVPKVLNKQEIVEMADDFIGWYGKMHKLLKSVEQTADGILCA
ncbi:putative 26S proteasome non-ATPase regulatory subunit 13 [Trichinella spiralis]|uniref:26S proteasome non-ATPase regulatory subunit 13 n=1 Tax=Trichinella spiralis TaxID=6334 RepID=E5SAF0_TRISP|nr:putative 26S proteasome non-ATPase regulatory subunit 13 [Trichinella spiralis]KRY31005.1 26S proteasome non-ATPase regulatory subunit 13 [Trichinella spiralis]